MMRYFVYIAILLLSVGCFGEEEYDTQIVLRPMQQIYDGADYTALSGVVGYAFAADTADLNILSYADAASGVVTSRTTGEVVPSVATTSEYVTDMSGFEGAVAMRIAGHPMVTILAVDTVNEDYAYSYYEVGVNIPTTYIALTFRSWYEGMVEQGDWVYVVPEGNGEEDPDVTVVGKLDY